ncbi:MAG: hypothetical protein VZR33_02455 [Methanosphaera sp.]|nr:hypothetical protein [Methanosphaera sp.]
MNKENFIIKFKEAQIKNIEDEIFEENKDSAVRTIYLQKKYQIEGINISRVYARIVNYQIRKYGTQLVMAVGQHLSKQDFERLRVNSRNRRKSRLGRL